MTEGTQGRVCVREEGGGADKEKGQSLTSKAGTTSRGQAVRQCGRGGGRGGMERSFQSEREAEERARS